MYLSCRWSYLGAVWTMSSYWASLMGAICAGAGEFSTLISCAIVRTMKHLILRAEAIWKFQPPLPASRPWWKLWGRVAGPGLPAVVSEIRNVA